ncbi:MAG: dCTP deaminase [Terricaulis sp.]|nr:dCTP deaminase [Terricaulis sp.]
MILADNELRAQLGRLEFETSNPNFPFDAERQIQPCSIDLRLSDVFWKPRAWRTLDLSDATPLGPKVSKAFKRVRLAYPDGYLLRPGCSVLARTYEKFSIPEGFVGWLVGRSSLARLGLSVCSAAHFINPGWRGHMPLLISNNSPFAIRIQPYLGIVQFCLLTSSSVPSRLYGARGIGSKYVDDDGGPSRFWQDHTIKRLLENPNATKATPEVGEILRHYADRLDEPTQARFARHIEQYGVVSDIRTFFAAFVASERQRSNTLILISTLTVIITGVVVSWLPSLIGRGLLIGAFAGALVVSAVALVLWQVVLQRNSTISSAELSRMAREMYD